MRTSKTLARLRAGKVALGANISIGPSLITAGLAGKLGFDFAWLDMEHRWYNWHDAAIMIYGCREGGVDAIVRVPDTSPATFHRCFELGAAGTMLPHCKSAADAANAVRNSKFAPVGLRGIENVLIDGEFGLVPLPEFMEKQTRESVVVVQIEDREALDCIDQITGAEGVDALFVGPGDLSQSLGRPGDMANPDLVRAIEKVAKACQRDGKAWGLPTGPNPDNIKKYVDLGARFIVPAVDYVAILTSWQKPIGDARDILAKKGLD